MSDLYMGKYRIPSARLQTWNYANMGMYFITICCEPRNHFFGEVINGRMQLNDIGLFAESEWKRTPILRPDMNIRLGEFVFMPDHVHMIFNIGSNQYNGGIGIKIVGVDWVDDGGVPNGDGLFSCRDAMHRVPTGTDPAMHRVPTGANRIPEKNQFGPQRKNVGSVIRGFKSSVTIFTRKNKLKFGWQSLFHDHIIRSPNEYRRIARYIIRNPLVWEHSHIVK